MRTSRNSRKNQNELGVGWPETSSEFPQDRQTHVTAVEAPASSPGDSAHNTVWHRRPRVKAWQAPTWRTPQGMRRLGGNSFTAVSQIEDSGVRL